MKAYRKNNKIMFKIVESSSEVIEKILKLLKDLLKASENRNITTFPVYQLKTFVSLCNSLSSSVEDKYVPKKFIEYVNENKEALGYFKEIENKIKATINLLETKRKVFKSFKESIEVFKDII